MTRRGGRVWMGTEALADEDTCGSANQYPRITANLLKLISLHCLKFSHLLFIQQKPSI